MTRWQGGNPRSLFTSGGAVSCTGIRAATSDICSPAGCRQCRSGSFTHSRCAVPPNLAALPLLRVDGAGGWLEPIDNVALLAVAEGIGPSHQSWPPMSMPRPGDLCEHYRRRG